MPSPIRTSQNLQPHRKPTLAEMVAIQAAHRALQPKGPVFKDREAAFADAMARADAELASGPLAKARMAGVAQAQKAA